MAHVYTRLEAIHPPMFPTVMPTEILAVDLLLLHSSDSKVTWAAPFVLDSVERVRKYAPLEKQRRLPR